MIPSKQKVKDLCEKVYSMGYQQIVIDLIQDDLEELLNKDEEVVRDEIGAASYECSILLEVFNPKFEKDVGLLTELIDALNDWQSDHESVNRILGLPPEA